MNQAYSPALSELLSSLLWVALAVLVAVGLCFCGGHAVYLAWTKVGPARRRRRLAESTLIRESAKGIAQIEAYLATQLAPRDPPPSDGAGNS